MSDDGTYFCAGTSSGDIVKMSTSDKVMISFGPQKHKFSLVSSSSVTSIFSFSSSLLVTESRTASRRTVTKLIHRLHLFVCY